MGWLANLFQRRRLWRRHHRYGAFRFSPGCCCNACRIFLDIFFRSASTNLGPDWTEVSGDWEIVSPGGLQTGDNLAIALLENRRVRTINASVTARSVTVNDSQFDFARARIYMNYEDEDNQYHAEFGWQDNGVTTNISITLRVFSGGAFVVGAGWGTTVNGVANNWDLKACITRDSIFIGSMSQSGVGTHYAVLHSLSPTEGRYALGSPIFLSGQLAHTLYIEEFRAATVRPIGEISGTDCDFCIPCGVCEPPHRDGLTPMQFRVTIDGDEYILEYEPISGQDCRWFYEESQGSLNNATLLVGNTGMELENSISPFFGQYSLDPVSTCEGPTTLPRVSGTGPLTITVEAIL